MSLLTDILNVLKQDGAKDVLPIIVADFQGIQANPDLVLNIVSQPAELLKLQGDLLQALSPSGQFAKDVVSDVTGFIVGYFQSIKVPAAQALKAKAP